MFMVTYTIFRQKYDYAIICMLACCIINFLMGNKEVAKLKKKNVLMDCKTGIGSGTLKWPAIIIEKVVG